MSRNILRAVFGLATLALASTASAASAPAGVKDALANEPIGLLPGAGFQLRTGKCTDCPVPKQNLWYFENEIIAVPASSAATASFTPGSDRNRDVANWAATPASAQLAHPSLVWMGAPQVLEGATVLPGARTLRTVDGKDLDMRLVPKLSTNRSFANGATFSYFEGRQVRLRGALGSENGRPVFTARTIWPADFSLDTARLKNAPLKDSAELTALVREPLKPQQGVDTRLLWERHPGQARNWQDKPVLGIVLNGAQGDDDESLGGHFAIATGRFGKNGDWSGWAVNNFYNLDSVSEKGIVAATVPMDNYLMDVNSGQQYYRPSYMLVAVLNNQRTAVAFQGGVQRVFNHFYRHDFRYRHAAANCTGISVDVFEALGWHVPKRGPTAPIKSLGAYAYLSAKDVSFASGRKIYDYLNEEQTRLFPAVAFDAMGQDLLQLVSADGVQPRALSTYEQQLRDDVEAIMLVRIAQVPSSRANGSAPVFSFDEFRSRVPQDQSQWKIVPVADRPFPVALQGEGFVAEKDPSVVPLPIAGIGATLVLGAVAWRRRKQAQKKTIAATQPSRDPVAVE
ncbi:hypothetical protein G4G28_01640 [Massilia sp. Dwa41.01b]|uniref:hypothetical protein n=1 Tax=unclassified Massilia TaxID=2609279 RepID=UPI0016027B10|nr:MULTISPECIES: hypothetical protein [unclassified Massilia]QNA87493.1 hypothetical protein G4G28_01640 [Massilia sp. Dwa41.01b]QNA98399.1 hypothetical protein G4G31_05400 [Massilia sp. Se16.2.3]